LCLPLGRRMRCSLPPFSSRSWKTTSAPSAGHTCELDVAETPGGAACAGAPSRRQQPQKTTTRPGDKHRGDTTKPPGGRNKRPAILQSNIAATIPQCHSPFKLTQGLAWSSAPQHTPRRCCDDYAILPRLYNNQ